MTQPRHRLRRCAKLVGTVTTVAAAIAWGLSICSATTLTAPGKIVAVNNGSLICVWGTPETNYEARFTDWKLAKPDAVLWLPRYRSPGANITSIIIPLWMPVIALALPTYFLWRRDHRHPPGHCQSCGYNLTGNKSGVCPECGTVI